MIVIGASHARGGIALVSGMSHFTPLHSHMQFILTHDNIVLVHQHDVTVVHRIAYHGENVGMKMRYSHFSYAYSIQQLNKALTVYDYQ